MEEKDLTAKISLLKGVKPRQDWVLLAKSRILGQADIPQVAPLHEGFGSRIMTEAVSVFKYLTIEKPAFALASILLFMGAGISFHASQSLPGDTLYSLRSAGEDIQSRLASQGNDVPQLQAAQRRMEDLKKIVEGNRSQNLASAIKEYENSVSEASKQLAKLAEENPEKALLAGKEILELAAEKVRMEEVLGTKFGGEESQSLAETIKIVVEIELADLETRTLSDTQKETYEKAKEAYAAGSYEAALENIWFISQESVDH